MERIGRPGDDFRARLSVADIERICRSQGIAKPDKIVSEQRGNEMVAYHLDDTYFLSFGLSDCTQRKVEVLRVLEHLAAIPSPKVIAWSERDPDLQVPYMIVERCPGSRLDMLWEECGPEERLRLLRAQGESMGRYHTITLADAQAAARRAGVEQWVVDASEHQSCRARAFRREAPNSLKHLGTRLEHWEIGGSSLTALLEEHYASGLPEPDEPFVGSGLFHTEPFTEHFIVERTGNAFRLSGCVDMEECAIADSFDEIVEMFVSILALDKRYLAAFREGYEQWFSFPSDAEHRLLAGAVDHDLSNVLWLLDTMEERPEWSFARSWLSGHLQRLEGWIDNQRRVDKALFRKDIGPW